MSERAAAMGNLGGYQWMTTAAKAVHGPRNLAILSLVGGYVALRPAESAVKLVVRQVKQRIKPSPTRDQVFQALTTGEDPSGLTIDEGAEYRVLESDGDAVLIELIGDPNNPHFVSGTFLATISAFPRREGAANQLG